MSNPFTRLSTGWQTFWFRPCPTSTLAIFRDRPSVSSWRSGRSRSRRSWVRSSVPGSALPEVGTQGPGVWSLLTLTGNTLGAAIAIWLILLVAAVALSVGYRTRLAAVLVFVGLMTIERHTPLVGNTGDGLIRVLAFYLMFSPAGEALSVDRWRTDRERFWEFPERAPWALRLMQIQLSVVYLSTVWEKLQGETWRNGTAVSYALRALEVQRIPSPAFVVDSLALTQMMTLGTVALELALGILVWNRAARPLGAEPRGHPAPLHRVHDHRGLLLPHDADALPRVPASGARDATGRTGPGAPAPGRIGGGPGRRGRYRRRVRWGPRRRYRRRGQAGTAERDGSVGAPDQGTNGPGRSTGSHDQPSGPPPAE